MKQIAPDSSNILIGGIIAMFQLTGTTGFVDFGHVATHGLTPSVDRGIMNSDRSGVQEEIYSWLKSRGMLFDLEAQELTRNTLMLALMSNTPATQSQTVSTVTDEAFTARHDKWVRVANRKISSVVVTSSPAGTTYTVNTDYEVDAELGMIRVKSTGTIADAASLLVDYGAAAMTSLYKADLLQTSRFAGSLIIKLIGENGFRGEIHFPSVEVQPKGNLALTTGEPMKMGFTIKVLKSTAAADAGAEWGTFRELTAAT